MSNNVLPQDMEQIKTDSFSDIQKGMKTIEDYIGYMSERIDFYIKKSVANLFNSDGYDAIECMEYSLSDGWKILRHKYSGFTTITKRFQVTASAFSAIGNLYTTGTVVSAQTYPVTFTEMPSIGICVERDLGTSPDVLAMTSTGGTKTASPAFQLIRPDAASSSDTLSWYVDITASGIT